MLKYFVLKILNLLQSRNSIWLLPLVTLIIYSNTFYSAFQFDDITSILENDKIRNIWDIKQWWAFNSNRPVGYFTFALNYSLHQYQLFGYHLLNIIIHSINGILIFYLIKQILNVVAFSRGVVEGNRINYLPILGALLFLAHPLCTEAVTYITQRLVSLATLFYLCSIIYYLKGRILFIGRDKNISLPNALLQNKTKNQKILWYYFLVLLFALLAFLTKEIAYTLPFTILLFELFLFQKLNQNIGKKIIIANGILVLLFFIFAIFTNWQKYFVTVPPIEGNNFSITPLQYFYTQFRVITTYIRLFFLPYNQHLDYYYPLSEHFFEIKTFFSFLFLLTIVLFAIFKIKKNKIITIGIFWFFITLLPQSSLFVRPNVIFEHRAYLPIIGLIIAIIGLILEIKIKNEQLKYFSILFFTAVLFVFGILTYLRNEKWKTAYSLWYDSYIKSPEKPRVSNNLGQIMYQYKKYDSALFYYNKSLQLNPSYAEVYYNRSLLYNDLKQFSKALQDLDSAISINPHYFSAYNNKAILLYQMQDTLSAIAILSFVIEHNPSNLSAYINRAIIFAAQQQWEKAYQDINKAAKLDKKNSELLEMKRVFWRNYQQSNNNFIKEKN